MKRSNIIRTRLVTKRSLDELTPSMHEMGRDQVDFRGRSRQGGSIFVQIQAVELGF
jgi:hypothetical protein